MSDTESHEGAVVQSFTTYQVTPPSKFSFKSVDWPRWIRRFVDSSVLEWLQN